MAKLHISRQRGFALNGTPVRHTWGQKTELTPVLCLLASNKGALKLAARLGDARISRKGTWASPRNLGKDRDQNMISKIRGSRGGRHTR